MRQDRGMQGSNPVSSLTLERIQLAHQLSRDILNTARSRVEAMSRYGKPFTQMDADDYRDAFERHQQITERLLNEILALGNPSVQSSTTT